MSIIPSGFLEAVAVFTTPSPGGPAMVATAHEKTAGGTADDAAEVIAEQCWGAANGLVSVIDGSYSLVNVNVYWNSGGADLQVGQWSGGLTGGEPGTAAPPQVAMLINKSSGLAGRRNRGRMYVPGVNGSLLGEDGVMGPTGLGEWQTAANAFYTFSNSLGYPMVILHNQVGISPTVVASLQVQSLCATQRRRIR